MHSTRRTFLATSVGCGSVLLLPGRALAQPQVPALITLVVGVAAGSVTDALARIVARQLAKHLKTVVIVDNKPGAGQVVGINTMRAKPADGSTLLYITGSAVGQAPAFRTDLNYEPLRDFSFVALSAVSPGVIAARNSLPASNVRELVEYAKQNPGKLNFGSAGAGNAGHLQMEYLMKVTGTKMTHIPFKSDPQQVLELGEGRLDVSIITAAAALPFYKAGRIKLLAVTSRTPVASLPGVQHLTEVGLPALSGLDPFTFFGIVGPAGMPAATVAMLNEAHNAGMRDPEVVTTLRETLSSEPMSESPDEFRRFVTAELRKWAEIGKDIKIN